MAIATGAALLCASAAPGAQSDSANPTCPASPNWAANQVMSLTPVDRGNQRVLLAEGVITPGLADRLRDALAEDDQISEIWFRSPGGDAYAGNEAGRMLRSEFPGIITRIPSGWACFSACNFAFMGGQLRIVEPQGQFMVHMFTHTGNRDIIRQEVEAGTDSTLELIGEIEQSSAQLATEDNDFLIRMGVSRRLLSEVMYATQAVGDGETRRCLTQDEAYSYNVANVRE
ncbi:hypothetical protein [Parasphingopyxis sp.]|uniref:COG3904 family protein n=1 Tax=Parasphingopyxis sp. TaxID=1920299 RepID=UPI002601EF68|nr:hypothetical protein [Parasphingopyxis sp.]